MGMQDRDYYRERHKVTPQSPGSTARKSRRNSTGIAYLLYPLITLSGTNTCSISNSKTTIKSIPCMNPRCIASAIPKGHKGQRS